VARSLPLVALLAAVALATAWAPARAAGPSAAGDVDPAIADGSAQRSLDAARASWRRRGMRDYRFRLTLACFCAARYRRPVTIVVRGGRPESAPAHVRHAATVPRLLGVVQAAIDGRAAGLRVTYARHGIPRLVRVDSSDRIVDEEVAYRLDRFAALR
jgi:uncharacterized protein DUF6174